MSHIHVKLLENAYQQIKAREHVFICYAISEQEIAEPHHKATHKAANDITKLIHADLNADGHWQHIGTLEHWLEYNNYTIKYPDDIGKIVEARLAWITALIEYWRDK